MDVREALLTRRTVQRFAPGEVPEAVLERALHAATYAPNHKLTWPWRFTRVGPAGREALAELKVRLTRAKRELTPEQASAVRHKMLAPDRLVVVSQRLAGDPVREQEDYATCACAIHNLSLSLHADGYVSKWSSGAVTTHPETYELLGIDPHDERVVGFVWVGRPEIVPAPAPRPAWQTATRSVP